MHESTTRAIHAEHKQSKSLANTQWTAQRVCADHKQSIAIQRTLTEDVDDAELVALEVAVAL